ncbi:DUF1294 domain-containing protein [Microvirga sp. STS02]|uniref:DUF1294 domain-containing protein n=1 Tax=Hymenobacter negativus TaxID=2795026 RepID=UPI0018DDF613|nr:MULTISPECIES: DUF1294 domain-containing protein [Bacteria]MBH8569119.1 DUF1294 domain-containing protein [Hymenobacter negativus]MBR7208854.1 DUF1294 domain-containing protein [Microvirga sp. STS02]
MNPPNRLSPGLQLTRPKPRASQSARPASHIMKILLSCLLFFNLLCFLLFALDKRKARRNQRRIAEKTLHLATLPGAAPGAWAAVLLLHHKNRKATFWSVTLMLTLLQGAVIYFTWPYLQARF